MATLDDMLDQMHRQGAYAQELKTPRGQTAYLVTHERYIAQNPVLAIEPSRLLRDARKIARSQRGPKPSYRARHRKPKG